ncbi:putative helicase mov-10-B.1 [Hyposmocoma kahamanoa]|uniref:putative helicase mov-10-B.1 n=1 Tax=Hyposmocoma kahamanoa TaxID=1477025 RepID=UPI000E6D7D2F|nr:putative helicase mov-10-B.1 [Hyposmocoma kahamanoa]
MRDNYCRVCGVFDEYFDENSGIQHNATAKHQYNLILYHYNLNKRTFTSNRDGIFVYAIVESKPLEDCPGQVKEKTDHAKIRIYVKPSQEVKFSFEVKSDIRKEDIYVVGIQLSHPQPQFIMNDHKYRFGDDPHVLQTKSTLQGDVYVTFKAGGIGQYEMPIVFTFHRPSDSKNIIIIREMVINVEENPTTEKFVKSPFTNEEIGKALNFVPSTDHMPYERFFKIPKLLKTLLPEGLDDDALDSLRCSEEMRAQLREILISTRSVIEEGTTEENYVMYFHYLLWWEEIIARINIRKYNMAKVTIECDEEGEYLLEVPGLAEKRPSLLRGDRVFLIPILEDSAESRRHPEILFESIIGSIKEDSIKLMKLDDTFEEYYTPERLFNVKFLTSRIPLERMHHAVQNVFTAKQGCRIFPKPVKYLPKLQPIKKFYNELIRDNEEQRSAVEHIVSKTSGTAPYIVFGPPGTGKTMTIVEAIIQIVVKNPKHRVLVCTDSNMAADHIALMLVRYNKILNINNFLLRANSQNREWCTSLLERLWNTYKNLYEDDPNYITVLVKNFRSDADILRIPNELFYWEKPLQPQAHPDVLSRTSILDMPGGDRAIVFHSVNSREQRMGNAPSYFNEKELMMLQKYIIALTREHSVLAGDIGVIAPYIRQVYKMRDWLKLNNYEDVEIGTVESFQGKEKRVILVSTVRANCRLLDYDAKYGLGFLVDDKRFNVALTRAKAKLIIIGNATCLVRDEKWRKYMNVCKEYDCYIGQETEQMPRTEALLKDVTKTRFAKCLLSEVIEKAMNTKVDKKIKNKKKNKK